MQTLYDTNTVHPLDRFDHYRAGAGVELAPMTIHGRAPGRLSAVLSVAQVGDFQLEALTWSADSQVVACRTERLIRASDPECYRLILSVNAELRLEQVGNQTALRARDIGLYDLSCPVRSTQLPGPGPMRWVMITFPRTLVSVSGAAVRPLIGTAMPKGLPGRSLIAQFLIGLTETVELAHDPGLADVLHACTVGLIRQRLGLSGGISKATRQLLYQAHVRDVIRRNLNDPALDPGRIARAANISPRYLHQIFQSAEHTPMQLLKRQRLVECRRRLQDPALVTTPVKDVIAAHGYIRLDQFARDFKQMFGISASQVRGRTGPGVSGSDR